MRKVNLNTNGTAICLMVIGILLFISANSFTVSQTMLLPARTANIVMPPDYTRFCGYNPSDNAALERGQEVVEHPITSTTEDRYEIFLPNVRQAITEYRDITFRKGDEVTINACGCVQTGGKGKTWKRYVSPLGPDSDRLYHGLFTTSGGLSMIPPPGTTSPQNPRQSPTVRSYKGRPISIFRIDEIITAQGNGWRFGIPRDSYLILGYEDGDGDYNDNGYSGHDDGNPEQCVNIGGVGVEIIVKHK
jgi:hypothetical protein